MGRSVSIPSGAVNIAYFTFSPDDEYDAQVEWDDMIESTRESIKSLWNSFEDADRWIGREDRVILENDHAYVTISEYCGLVALCMVPKEGNLAENWCNIVGEKFERVYGEYVSIGRASNGEQFFRKRA